MDALKRIPVVIAGEWRPVSYVGRLLWEGTATADQPITAIALARDGNGAITWSRAGRGHSAILHLQLRVEPDEASDSRSAARVILGIQPEGKQWGDGKAWLDRTVTLTSDAPFFLSLDHAVTGSEYWMAQVRDTGRLKLGALFVCEEDTRSARNHLWHLRGGKTSANDQLTEALNYARQGSIQPQM